MRPKKRKSASSLLDWVLVISHLKILPGRRERQGSRADAGILKQVGGLDTKRSVKKRTRLYYNRGLKGDNREGRMRGDHRKTFRRGEVTLA